MQIRLGEGEAKRFSWPSVGEGESNDIYCAEFENGAFVRRERLGESINTDGPEDTPCIAPDESYLIFSKAPDFNSGADLYISFRNQDGTWGEAVAMTGINTQGHDLGPHLSPDGLYLFFVRTTSAGLKPFWVRANVIDDYR